MKKIKIILASIFVLVAALSISSFSACAQGANNCVLNTYSFSKIISSSVATRGLNGQFPQTLAQIQQVAAQQLGDSIDSQFGTDFVECDLKCRGRISSNSQIVSCKATPIHKVDSATYDCNVAGTQCTASANYKFICKCEEA